MAALVFVDSFLPPAAASVRLAPPAFMDRLRALSTDGVLPPWSSWFGGDAMHDLVGDERLREALTAEMRSLPLSYFETDVPLPDHWSERRCGYILLSDRRTRGVPASPLPAVGR